MDACLLKPQAPVGKATLRTFPLFPLCLTSVDLSALDAMINHLSAPALKDSAVSPLIIKPQAENQQEAGSQVEQEKNVYIQPDHRPKRLETLDVEQPRHTGIIVNPADSLTQQFRHTQDCNGQPRARLDRRRVCGD